MRYVRNFGIVVSRQRLTGKYICLSSLGWSRTPHAMDPVKGFHLCKKQDRTFGWLGFKLHLRRHGIHTKYFPNLRDELQISTMINTIIQEQKIRHPPFQPKGLGSCCSRMSINFQQSANFLVVLIVN